VDDRFSETAKLTEPEPVSRVFRFSKSSRNEAIFVLLFFTIIFFGSGFLMGLDAPSDRRKYTILFNAVLWLIPSGISLWGFLAY
tara:strand:+ start:17818 stop:18069 length:252 start_codon:yes stop_codon:yes gene_type:complete